MSKLPRHVFNFSPERSARLLARVIARREARAADRAVALRAGILPPKDVVDGAPIMDAWTLIPCPHGPLYLALDGVATGHPLSPRRQTPIISSPLHYLDVERGLACTEGRYWRLGVRRHDAAPAPQPEPGPVVSESRIEDGLGVCTDFDDDTQEPSP